MQKIVGAILYLHQDNWACTRRFWCLYYLYLSYLMWLSGNFFLSSIGHPSYRLLDWWGIACINLKLYEVHLSTICILQSKHIMIIHLKVSQLILILLWQIWFTYQFPKLFRQLCSWEVDVRPTVATVPIMLLHSSAGSTMQASTAMPNIVPSSILSVKPLTL